MHPLKAINEKLQSLQRLSETQGIPLSTHQVALLCIEFTAEVTAVLDGLGALPDPAPVEG